MATPAATTYISKALADSQIVTYRSLSRGLSIHVNDAKNQLAAFYESAASSTEPVSATYLVTGDVSILPTPAEPSDTPPDASDPQPINPPRLERRITLASQTDLDTVKAQFTHISSIHVYSISPAPIKDIAILTTSTRAVRDIDGERGLDHAKRVGMMVAPDVKWIATKRPAAQPLKPHNTSKVSLATVAPEPTKKPQGEKKTGTLDFSKAKPKAEPAEPPVKKEPAPPKKSGTLDWGKSKAKIATPSASEPIIKPKKPESKPKEEPQPKVVVKPDPEEEEKPPSKQQPAPSAAVAKLKKESTARPLSKQSTARPLSKQRPSIATEDLKVPETAGSKRATPSADDDEEEEESPPARRVKPKLESPSSSSSKSSTNEITGRLKKGRIVSDDEDEKPAKAVSKKRKSEPLSDDDGEDVKSSRVQRGKAAGKRRPSTDSELMDMMNDDDDDDTTGDHENDDEDGDSAPEHVPFTKNIKGMPKKPKATGIDVVERKKKVKVPTGSNGKPKKRVVKTRMSKNAKGFMVSEDYSEWETSSEMEAEAEPKKKKAKAKAPTGSNGKPKKRVVKTRMSKNEKGFMVSEDYSEWETGSETETEAKPAPKKKAKVAEKESKTDAEMSTDGGSSKPKPKPKPRASLPSGKSAAKPKGQSSVASFFKKKE